MIIMPRPWSLWCKIEVWILTTYPILRKGFWEAKYSPLEHTWWLPIFNTGIMLCLLPTFFFICQLTITFTIYNRKLTLLKKFCRCFKRTVSVRVDFWPLFFVFLQWRQSNSKVPIPQYPIGWHARMSCGVFTLI